MDSEQHLKRYKKRKQNETSKSVFPAEEDWHAARRRPKRRKTFSFKSVSGWLRRPTDRPSVRGVLALPPAVHRTDTVHHSTKPEQRCGGRERSSSLNTPPRPTNTRTVQLIPQNRRGESIRTEHKTPKEFKLYYNIYCKIHISDWKKTLNSI